MAKKKHGQWKQQVRAEVAAALQGQAPTPLTKTNLIGAAPVRPTTQAQHNPEHTIRFDSAIQADLKQITWLTIVLIALLSLATITDRQTGWLETLTTRFEAPESQGALTPDTSPAVDLPD